MKKIQLPTLKKLKTMKKILLFTIFIITSITIEGQNSIPDGTFFQIGNYSTSNDPKGILFTGYRDVVPNYFGASIEAFNDWTCCNGYPNGGYAGVKNIGLDFKIHDPNKPGISDAKITALLIASTGNVGIGINNPQNKLDVNGTIHAKEVKVDLSGWPDYVFKTDYALLTLEEVEKHIKEKGYLPSVPSEADVLKNGINLGDNQRLLLQKIEELTLYSIEQNKQIKELKNENKTLKQESLQIKTLVERLEKLEKIEKVK